MFIVGIPVLVIMFIATSITNKVFNVQYISDTEKEQDKFFKLLSAHNVVNADISQDILVVDFEDKITHQITTHHFETFKLIRRTDINEASIDLYENAFYIPYKKQL